MPYDPAMADRIRDLLYAAPGFTERKMFGGVGFMIGGNMACGAHNDGRLMVRCHVDDHAALTGLPGAEGLVHGGGPKRGWVLVDADAVVVDDALATWVERGRGFAASLPPKRPKAKKRG